MTHCRYVGDSLKRKKVWPHSCHGHWRRQMIVVGSMCAVTSNQQTFQLKRWRHWIVNNEDKKEVKVQLIIANMKVKVEAIQQLKLVHQRIRDADLLQNGWIFGKVPNGLWPPLIFGKSYCGFRDKITKKVSMFIMAGLLCIIWSYFPWDACSTTVQHGNWLKNIPVKTRLYHFHPEKRMFSFSLQELQSDPRHFL